MATNAKQVVPIKPDNHMRIWSQVEKTDPKHTKKVNQRGGFTAISAHYQIMRATETFGPIGEGWGYVAGVPIILDGIVSVPVTIWHGQRDNSYGPIYGGADLKDTRGKPDSDALKKAETDGLTKGLAQLGFNADVFLGRFDDNKYVAELAKEFGEHNDNDGAAKRVKLDGPYTSKTALWQAVRGFDREVRSCGDLDQFTALMETGDTKALLAQVERDAPSLMDGGDNLPAEFEPLRALLAKTRTNLEAGDDSWKSNPLNGG